jgi:phosphoribosylcarboxyaminoimidazole (NCAIR) mutase
MALGKSGARNAGILAAQIIALADAAVAEKLARFRAEMTAGVEAKAKVLQTLL